MENIELTQKNEDFLVVFKNNIQKVVDLLKKDSYQEARIFFNEKIITEYFKSEFLNDVLKPFKVFLYEFDEYFNNENIKIYYGYSDKEYKEYILDMYTNDFLEKFNDIKNKQ